MALQFKLGQGQSSTVQKDKELREAKQKIQELQSYLHGQDSAEHNRMHEDGKKPEPLKAMMPPPDVDP